MKRRGERITMLTAYDFITAALLDDAGIDVILVGDSLGNVVLGHDTTVAVTLDDMLHHTKAVARGAQRAMVVGDMPFLTYHTSVADALRNAGRFLQEAGAHAVKIEGGEPVVPQVLALTQAGIPVMGHLGLTPQSVYQLGGFRVQGRTEIAAKAMIEDAKRLEEAGAFAIVLECVTDDVAADITAAVNIPTIGIGAGVHCDGQVLVTPDALGLTRGHVPKFVKQYAALGEAMLAGVRQYIEEVRDGSFPSGEFSYGPSKAAQATPEAGNPYGGR
jgi:3-methyl-2-oxobutanoate hydroxymethyltransferase